MFSPQHAHNALPVYGIKINIRENLTGKIKSVFIAGSGKKCKMEKKDGHAIIEIKKLDAHMAIVCEVGN